MDIFEKTQPFQFGEAIYPNGGRYGPISHEHLNIAIILEGKSICCADGVMRQFSAGQATCIYNVTELEFSMPRGQRYHSIWCHTGELALPKGLKSQLKTLPTQMTPSALLEVLIREGINLGQGNSGGLVRVRNSLGEAVFNEYVHMLSSHEETKTLPPPLLRAKQFIDQNYCEPCDLSIIANAANLNPRYLIRLFKKHLNTTPSKYLWQLRTQRGASLLLQTGLTVSEIAYQSGFQTSHHFARHIKAQYGYSPSDLREHRSQQDPYQFNQDIIQSGAL